MQAYHLTLPRHIDASLQLPASKSLSARALILSVLAHNSHVSGLSQCDDTRVLLDALQHRPDEINIGAAGTAMRFLTALLAATDSGCHTLTGTPRMQQRPIGLLVEALRSLGARIDYLGQDGFPPLRIEGGHMTGGSVGIPATVSSQYISALLMVAPILPDGLTLTLEGDVASMPYIHMTMALMAHFGAQPRWADERTIVVPATGYADCIAYAVEPDWSAASYWYEFVALSPDPATRIVLKGLTADSLQGDSAIAGLFHSLGVRTTFTDEGAVLTKADAVTSIKEMNLEDCPDLAQTIVSTCAALHIPFRITGLHSLKIKETDRIAALQTEWAKMGVTMGADGDSLWVEAYSPAAEAAAVAAVPTISTYDDHRMAMAFAPCAALVPGLGIAEPAVVSKSYPEYWDHLRHVGAVIDSKEADRA